jgi:hypothetical protein
MQSTGLLSIALLLAVFSAYRILRNLVRLSRADTARRARLQELAGDATLPLNDPPSSLARTLDRRVQEALKEDFTLTGVLLAALGVSAVFTGREIGYGQWAVGLYTAGLCGIVGGVALALLGGVLRVIHRPLAETSPDEDDPI